MYNIMYTQNHDKKTVIRGIMKNERLSSIISDAYNSPVGSTKRAQAKKILSVMTKLNGGAFDGQGGPSIPYQEPAPPTYSRLMVFPGAPKMMSPEERIRRDQMLQMNDGQGGAFSMTIPGEAPKLPVGTGATPAVLPPSPPSTLGQGARTTPLPSQTTPSTLPDPYQQYLNQGKTPEQLAYPGLMQSLKTWPTFGVQPPVPSEDNPVATTGTEALGPSQPSGVIPPKAGATGTPSTAPGTATAGGLPKAGSNTSSGSTTGKYSWLQQSINNNMGGTAFALGAMNDKDKLRQLPGFENVKDEDLPYGASLAKQVDELGHVLRKEYGLDQMLNEKNNMIATGVNLKGDLTDYITGRDEFLNQTNSMIERAKASMLTAPNAADPVVQNQNKSYLNYLYLLKGRQSKSYVDFLDSSVKKYEADLTDLTNHYDTALAAYERDLTSKTAITTEQYQMYYNALTDMYKTAEEAPQKKLEMEKTKLQMVQINSQMANDAIRAKADLYKAMHKDGSTFMDSWGNLQKIKAIDDKGNLNPNYTLADAENLNSLGIPMTDYMQAILLSGRNAMTNPDPKDGSMPGMSTIMKTGESLMSNMKMLEQHGTLANDPQTQSMAQHSAEQIKADTRSALKGNAGVLPADQQTKLVDAASYLAKGGGWNPFSSNKTVSRDTFLSKFKDSGVDEKFLDALFTNYQGYGNGKDFANNILNEMDNVNGKVTRVRTPEEVRNKVIDMMVEKNFTF